MTGQFLFGNDDAHIRQVRDTWRRRFLTKYPEGTLQSYDMREDGASQRLSGQVLQQGMFVEPTLIFIQEPTKDLETLLPHIPSSWFILVQATKEPAETMKHACRLHGVTVQEVHVPSSTSLGQWWRSQGFEASDPRLRAVHAHYVALERAVTKKRSPAADTRSWFLHQAASLIRLGASGSDLTSSLTTYTEQGDDLFQKAKLCCGSSSAEQYRVLRSIPEASWFAFLGSLVWLCERELVSVSMKRLLALLEIFSKNSGLRYEHRALLPFVVDDDSRVFRASWLATFH